MEITVVHPLRVYARDKIAQIKYVTIGHKGWDYEGRYKLADVPVASRMHQQLGKLNADA
jgi:hypothetical protein